MDTKKTIAALFDLDGVVLDTEGQYTKIWKEIGDRYTDIADFEQKIKGMTLTQILDKHFTDDKVKRDVYDTLYSKEQYMSYPYIKGLEHFVADLRAHSVKTVIVTSSNNEKMQNVYNAHPEFKEYFDIILTADDFSKSKPAPDCYLMGAQAANADIDNCVVFEDSKNGLISGKSALMKVVGLVTTNPRSVVEILSDVAIDDFTQFSYEEMIKL